MAHIRRGNTVLSQQSRFKRKYAQHMVNATADFLYPVSAPSPYRWTDEMNGFNPLIFKRRLKVKIEIGRIYTDKYIGFLRQ